MFGVIQLWGGTIRVFATDGSVRRTYVQTARWELQVECVLGVVQL